MKPVLLIVPLILALLAVGLAELPARTPAATALHTAGLTIADADNGQPATVLVARAGPAAAAEISQRGGVFVPDRIAIRPYRSVRIHNDDSTTHHAFCQSDQLKFTSGSMAPGSEITIQFPAAGTYEVRCAIHPKMRLLVTVERE